MAGLLDKREGKLTPWQRFIRPRAASREDVNEGYYANQMGLLGSSETQETNPAGTVSYGLLDGQQTAPQHSVTGPGTGYLGGQMGANEYNMKSDLNAARYYGEGAVTQSMANRAAMERTQWGNQNMSQQQQQQMALGMNTAVESFQTKFDNNTGMYQESIRGATVMDNLFPDDASYDTSSGSAQLAGVMRFMKQQNDGGAFMSDDMQNLARANGAGNMISDMWNWYTGAAFKNPDVMRDLHSIMRKQAISDSQKITAQVQSLREGVPWLNDQQIGQITRGTNLVYAQPTSTSTKPPQGRYTRIGD